MLLFGVGLSAKELAEEENFEKPKLEDTKVEQSSEQSNVQESQLQEQKIENPENIGPINSNSEAEVKPSEDQDLRIDTPPAEEPEIVPEQSSFGHVDFSVSSYRYDSTLLYNGQVFYQSTASRMLTSLVGQLEVCPWLYGFQVPVFSENQVTRYGPGSFYDGARREISQQGISNILFEIGREVDWGQVYFQYFTARKNFQENSDSASQKVQSRGYFQLKGMGEFEAEEKPLLAELQLSYHLPERTVDADDTEISTRSHVYQLGGKVGTRWEWQGSSATSQAYLGYLWTSERQASHSGVVPKDFAPTTHQALFRFEYSNPYDENIIFTFSYEMNHFFKRDFQTGSLSLSVAPSQSHLLEFKTSYSW